MSRSDAAGFLALHRSPATFVLPNVWDPGSARLLAGLGFPALATTSAGIAFASGRPDDGSLGRDRMLDQVAAIVAAVDVPVSADLESGYAPDAVGVAETIRGAIGAGAVGANLEDADPSTPGAQFEVADAADRVAAARSTAEAVGTPFTLNARIDTYLLGVPDPFAGTVARAAAYVAAGADCIFVPGVTDSATIARLADAIDAPLNVVAGLAGRPLTLAEYERLGVRRVSVGGSLMRATLGLVRRAGEQMLDGRFDFAAQAIPHGEINGLMGA